GGGRGRAARQGRGRQGGLDSLAPAGCRGGAGMEVVHRGGVIRRLREELPVGWQVTALGLVLAVTAVLAPALVLTFGLFLWARRQGWPSSRMRNLTLTLLATWLFGAVMQLWQVG